MKLFKLRFCFSLLCLSLAIGLVGCVEENSNDSLFDSSGNSEHPDLSNVLNSDTDLKPLSSEENGVQAHPSLQAYAERLEGADKKFDIGTEDGKEAPFIGKIGDVEVLPDGRILVLDKRSKTIKVYDEEGNFIRALSSPGRGPTEMEIPQAFDLSNEGMTLALAERTVKIKLLGLEDSSLTHKRTIGLDYTPEDVCQINDRVYVQGGAGNYDSGTIQAYPTRGGEPLAVFGQLYKTGNKALDHGWSTGKVACVDQDSLVIESLTRLPIIRAYKHNGARHWTLRVEDFTPVKASEIVAPNGKQGVTWEFGDTPYNRISSLNTIDDTAIVVQVSRITTDSEGERRSNADSGMDTYLIEPQTGSGKLLTNELPKVYDVTEDRIYVGSDYPFPQIEVYSY